MTPPARSAARTMAQLVAQKAAIKASGNSNICVVNTTCCNGMPASKILLVIPVKLGEV